MANLQTDLTSVIPALDYPAPLTEMVLTASGRPVLARPVRPDDADALESVREHHVGLHSFLSMRRMDANRRKASAFRLRFSQSFTSRLHRPSQAKVRSTTHRFGRTTKPSA